MNEVLYPIIGLASYLLTWGLAAWRSDGPFWDNYLRYLGLGFFFRSPLHRILLSLIPSGVMLFIYYITLEGVVGQLEHAWLAALVVLYTALPWLLLVAYPIKRIRKWVEIVSIAWFSIMMSLIIAIVLMIPDPL